MVLQMIVELTKILLKEVLFVQYHSLQELNMVILYISLMKQVEV
jgi:hypothetical protein